MYVDWNGNEQEDAEMANMRQTRPETIKVYPSKYGSYFVERKTRAAYILLDIDRFAEQRASSCDNCGEVTEDGTIWRCQDGGEEYCTDCVQVQGRPGRKSHKRVY